MYNGLIQKSAISFGKGDYMTPLAQKTINQDNSYKENELMAVLFDILDEAIDDMEQGRVQTIDEAWEEIDAI